MDRQQVSKTDSQPKEIFHPDRPGPSTRASLQPLHQLRGALGNRAFGRFIQAKLKVSEPGDAFEQEADRVADAVVGGQSAPVGHVSEGVQPKLYRMETRPEDAVDSVLPPDTEDEVPMVSPTDFGHPPMSPLRNTAIKAEAKPDGGPEKLFNEAVEPALPGENPALEAAPDPVIGGVAPPVNPPAVPVDGGAACKPPPGTAWTAGQHLVPAFSVTETESRSNTDSATTDVDTPTFTGDPAIDSAACLWRYQLKSVKGDGRIALVFYTVDHYPAPTPSDDSGELSNVTQANWNSIVTDLDTHKTGVAGNWSAYRRTILHERYHWGTEWQGSVKAELVKAENDIEKLSATFAAAPNAGAAKAVLEPQAKGVFAAAMVKARQVYNALGDSAGDPPYVAGSAGAIALIARIKAHATAKGW